MTHIRRVFSFSNFFTRDLASWIAVGSGLSGSVISINACLGYHCVLTIVFLIDFLIPELYLVNYQWVLTIFAENQMENCNVRDCTMPNKFTASRQHSASGSYSIYNMPNLNYAQHTESNLQGDSLRKTEFALHCIFPTCYWHCHMIVHDNP